jgi:MFS transporter, ACS family, D-galactonate transporter
LTHITPSRRWTIVILVSFGMIISYIDRTNLSVALALPEFKQQFHLSDTDRGMLNSAFFWSYTLLQIPAGFLVDRFGVKNPYSIGFILWSLVSAGTSFAKSFEQLFALRLLLGVGESIVTPAGMRWIRFNVEERQRGMAVGMLFAGAKMGPALGAPLAALLIRFYGWRAMFLIIGLGALLWLIPWTTLVQDDDRQLEAAAAKASGLASVPFLSVFKTPIIWGILVGTFCYNYFVYFCMTWLPAYFVERRHLSLSSMGWYTFFTFSGMAAVAILAGWWADRLLTNGADAVTIRKRFTIAGFVVASTEVFGAMSPSNEVAIFFAILSLSGLGLATGNYWALTQTLMPGPAIGRIVGLQNFASNASGIVAPILTGWLKTTTGSYEAPMQAIWLILITGVCAYAFLVRKKYASLVGQPI